MKHATEADAVPGQAEVLSTRNAKRAEEIAIEGLIDITDFSKVELRVAEVLTAERIPKADKLLLLSVDIGEEKPRQILAGIALHYEPEKLVGRKIAVVFENGKLARVLGDVVPADAKGESAPSRDPEPASQAAPPQPAEPPPAAQSEAPKPQQ